MRDYGKIFSTFWTSDSTRTLSDNGKVLALYLLTGPHSNIIGCFRLPDGYVAEDLGWNPQTVSEGFTELFRKGFATRDSGSKWVIINNYLKWNPLENPNQTKSALRAFEQVPDSCAVKPLLARSIHDHANRFLNGLESILAPFLNGSETLSEPFRNQEQEQEQEKEQEHTPEVATSIEGQPSVPAASGVCVAESTTPEAHTAAIRARHAGESGAGSAVDADIEFLQLCDYYPRKDPPLAAFPTWKSLKHNRRLPVGGVNAIMDSIDAWNQTGQWGRGFIPSLKNFLERESWKTNPSDTPQALPKLAEARAFVDKHGNADPDARALALAKFCVAHKLDHAAYAAQIA